MQRLRRYFPYEFSKTMFGRFKLLLNNCYWIGLPYGFKINKAIMRLIRLYKPLFPYLASSIAVMLVLQFITLITQSPRNVEKFIGHLYSVIDVIATSSPLPSSLSCSTMIVSSTTTTTWNVSSSTLSCDCVSCSSRNNSKSKWCLSCTS